MESFSFTLVMFGLVWLQVTAFVCYVVWQGMR